MSITTLKSVNPIDSEEDRSFPHIFEAGDVLYAADLNNMTDAIKNALAVTSSIGTAFNYKGSVDTYTELTAITTKAAGDVYNVKENDMNYVYTSDGTWDALGPSLEGYATTVDLSTVSSDLNTSKADKAHNHKSSDITDLTSVLSGYSKAGHKHTTNDITNLTATLADYVKTTTLTGYSETNHKHIASDITDLTSVLSSYSKTDHTHASITASIESLNTNKVNTADLNTTLANYVTTTTLEDYAKSDELTSYAEAKHTHKSSDITDLTSVLSSYSKTDHKHNTSDINDLTTVLAAYAKTNELTAYAEAKHTHEAGDITDLTSVLSGYSKDDHAHTDITNLINTLSASITALTNRITELENRVSALENPDVPPTDEPSAEPTE
jgi:hypothetical protein